MRREGYEFQVSPPRVLYQTINGQKCEPIERLVADVPADAVGAVIEKLSARKGELQQMEPIGKRTRLEFLVPSRGLFGYRNEFLTDTKGEGIMASVFDSYAPYKGDLSRRNTARPAVHRRGRARVCRHGRWCVAEAGGHHRQRLQEKAADQHPRRRL